MTVPSNAEGWAVPGFTEHRELGRDMSGRVVEAVHDVSGRRVAIRYLSPALAGDPVFLRRFRDEARMLVELDVPQVVRVHDFAEQPGQGAAVVMELVDGVTLRETIERQGPTGPEAALTVLKRALLALTAAHRLGIGHQDCKPENVLVGTDGNSKLGDFGLAVRQSERLPAAGTPLYLAPERWHGAPASPATDLYAVTAVFYECLTGRPPFAGTLPELREQHASARVPLDRVDPPLAALVARGMAKDPARRPHSAIAFVSELEALAASACGPGWEERGRGQLAERTAAILSITGTPAAAGAFTFTATVQDAEKPPQSITNTYTINIAPKSWTILTPDLPDGTVGTPYTATIEGTPGVTITWSASGLPPGLSFDPATATISGTPTQTAFVSVAVTATVTQPGAGTQSATAHYNLSIDPAPA